MNWDQIEIKWAEMASRVRADAQVSSLRAKSVAQPAVDATGARTVKVPEAATPVIAR